MSYVHNRLEQTIADIAHSAIPTRTSYQHPLFCEIPLPPFRQTTSWECRNRNSGLSVWGGQWQDDAGALRAFAVPYGRIARMILLHLNSEALRTASPVVTLPRSLRQFGALLGLPLKGSIRSEIREQLAFLSLAEFGMWRKDRLVFQGQIVDGLDDWYLDAPAHAAPLPRTVRLHNDYFLDLSRTAVSLDARVIAALAHNVLALDLYGWLIATLRDIAPGLEQRIRWEELHALCGSETKSLRHFVPYAVSQLERLQGLCPMATFRVETAGVLLCQPIRPAEQLAMSFASGSAT